MTQNAITIDSSPGDLEFADPALVEMASKRVCRLLRERIHSGALPPGKRLVRRTLAKELNVSPIPVIEALYQLAQEGLVENLPLHGARVPLLTVERIRNDLILREALDSQVARVLATALRPEQVTGLYAEADALDRVMSQAGPRERSGMDAHARFHFHLAKLTGYSVLVEETRRVWSRFFMQYAWLATELKPVPPDWHRQLIAAIASGDPIRADAAARHHVRRTPAEQEQDLAALARAVERINQPQAS